MRSIQYRNIYRNNSNLNLLYSNQSIITGNNEMNAVHANKSAGLSNSNKLQSALLVRRSDVVRDHLYIFKNLYFQIKLFLYFS